MSVGRAYCKTGILNNKLYVVGGVTRGRGGLIPLQSAEVYDPHTCMCLLLASYKGRLFVPQSLYCWPFFVDVGGEVYDPNLNSWLEMPIDMGEGWPARQAGTKSSVTVDDDLYALDPSNSVDSAKIKVCDYEGDTWKVAAGDVPIHDFTELESTYLFTRLLEKLHVITKDANHNIMVLQDDMQNEHVESAFSQ
ncbi:F-box/kelch-repeat protein [Glycine soja]